VLVMYAGWAVESALVDPLYAAPKHPYTKGLLSSMPRLGGRPKTPLPVIEGMVPGLMDMPPGCRFQNRCPEVMAICRDTVPPPFTVDEKHWARCFLYK
jgi:peptide/nickel transport system ATP-binding protein